MQMRKRSVKETSEVQPFVSQVFDCRVATSSCDMAVNQFDAEKPARSVL